MSEEKKRVRAMLDENYYWYRANQEELVKLYNGKQLLIADKEVVGAYDSLKEAYFAGEDRYGLGHFMLQKCSPGDRDTTMRIYSPYFKLPDDE